MSTTRHHSICRSQGFKCQSRPVNCQILSVSLSHQIPRSLISRFFETLRNTLYSFQSYPLHRIEFGPPKFCSKTFRFSMKLCSTLQVFGGGHFRKACTSRKKESKQSEITCKQSKPARTICKIEKWREFVRALCYQQCPKNSFKRPYIVKEMLFFG